MNTIGIIIVNNDGDILLTKPTGNNTLSFPKGLQDNNETFLETAIREVLEETGLDLKNINGEFSKEYYTQEYNRKNKTVHLFIFKSNENLKNTPIICNSFFERDGVFIPENDDSFWLSIKDSKIQKLHEAQLKIFNSIVEFFLH